MKTFKLEYFQYDISFNQFTKTVKETRRMFRITPINQLLLAWFH